LLGCLAHEAFHGVDVGIGVGGRNHLHGGGADVLHGGFPVRSSEKGKGWLVL